MNFFEKFTSRGEEKDETVEEIVRTIREEAAKKEAGLSEEEVKRYREAVEERIKKVRELGKEVE